MKTEQEHRSPYREIYNNLASRRLKPAFDIIGRLISDNSLGIYYDEYRNLEENYHFMLKYTVEGSRDPDREKVFLKLAVSVFELTDKIIGALLIKSSPLFEYERKRTVERSFPAGLENYLELLKQMFKPGHTGDAGGKTSPGATEKKSLPDPREQKAKMQELFHLLWFSDRLKPEESGLLRELLADPEIQDQYKSLLITGITLSLHRYFDPEKFEILFELLSSPVIAFTQRALVGLLLNLYRHDARMPFYPVITGRLKILNEDPEFKRNIERVILQLIRSKETEKLQQRIRDEIIPEMIRISPNLKNKINLDSLMEEGLSEEKNPEWEEIFGESPGLLDKMQEFSEMQMKGSDVFMGSFSMLKSFPFFTEPANWFMPFFSENPDLTDMPELSDPTVSHLIETIDKAPLLCNSDKYSFCFSLRKIPRENLEFMTRAMEAEMEQVKEIREDEELLDPGRHGEFISNQYIQDLYRFYKLFPRKGDFEDIFNWRFDFHNKFALGTILKEDAGVLRNIAEYYFAKDYFEEAAEIFSYLLEEEKNGELFQKVAWCYQKQGDYRSALDYYLKAELFGINQLWNMKRIAACHRNLKNPASALEYYREAEKNDPENLSNQLNIGQCLLELGRFDEALKCYFKVEYLAPGNKKVWRPIAWCSFLTGKKEQAEKYYRKLLGESPNKYDFMNMGHVQWSLGNRKDALEFYQKSVSEGGFTEEEFLEVFEEDKVHLLKGGIEKDDIPFMLDQLRYFLEG
jgi:tetratricopeptide (TPR) repeat protein